MQGEPLLRCKQSLREGELSSVTKVGEGDSDDRFSVVRSGLVPAEGVHEAARRVDLDELAREVEQIAVGWLHGEAVAAGNPEVEVGLRQGASAWAPPPGQLNWLGQHPERFLTRPIHRSPLR